MRQKTFSCKITDRAVPFNNDIIENLVTFLQHYGKLCIIMVMYKLCDITDRRNLYQIFIGIASIQTEISVAITCCPFYKS